MFQHQGPAYLQQISFRIIPEDAVRLAALQTKELQFITNVPTRDFQRLKNDRNLVLVAIPQAGTGYSLMMNEDRAAHQRTSRAPRGAIRNRPGRVRQHRVGRSGQARLQRDHA